MKKFIDGEYTSSFFTCFVETDECIKKFTPYNSSTLYHEFIHYFQQLLTAFGNLEIAIMKEFIEGLRYETQQDCKLSPPYNPKNRIVANNESFLLMLSYNAYHDPINEIVDIRSTLTNDTVNSYFVDSNGNGYKFGSTLIQECMANSLEKRHPNYTENPFYPYFILENLFKRKIKSNIDIVLPWLCFAAKLFSTIACYL